MPYLANFPGRRESHEIHQMFNDDTDKNYRCRVCGRTWQRKPSHGKCAGVPIFDGWENVPDGLYSKTALYRDHKRKLPKGTLPAAAVETKEALYTPLYALEQGDPDYKGKSEDYQ